MRWEGYFWVMLLKPLAAVVFLGVFYGFIWLVWKYLPESRIKRLLFTSWGEDNGPWAKRYGRTAVKNPERLPAPSQHDPQSRQAGSERR